MRSFKDNEGREWVISITVDTVKRVRALLDVNLLDVIGGDLLERLSVDPCLLCDVLFAICKPQVDERNLSDEDFGRGLAGDAIEHATQALLEGLADFFPSPKRAALNRALEKLSGYQTLAINLAIERLESPEFDAKMRQKLQAEPGERSGNSPASSESTPGP